MGLVWSGFLGCSGDGFRGEHEADELYVCAYMYEFVCSRWRVLGRFPSWLPLTMLGSVGSARGDVGSTRILMHEVS